MPADTTAADLLVIPYGIARVPPEKLDRMPQVEIDRAARTPLRLGDGPYRPNAVAEEAQILSEDPSLGLGAARLDLIRRLHLRSCDTFDRYLRRWIDLYFDFIGAQVRNAGDRLPALGRSPGAVIDPMLWAMAALRPLPRAHIPTGDGAFLAADVAMWTGDELIAVVLAGGEKARIAKNFSGQARVLTIEPPGDAAKPDLIAEQLGSVVVDFWHGLMVPPDPFGAAPFGFGSNVRPSF